MNIFITPFSYENKKLDDTNAQSSLNTPALFGSPRCQSLKVTKNIYL